MSQIVSKPKIEVVSGLRGLAALAVCWYHFTNGQSHWLNWTGQYGWLGVHVFFVISGFIIPYSMYVSRYRLRNFARFTLKRLARLHPPYMASIAVLVGLATLELCIPKLQAQAPDVSLTQLVLHATYLNDLAGRPWMNVVYWTLAVEFQWYLLIGLTFPFLTSRRLWVQMSAIAVLMTAFFLLPHDKSIIFHSVPIFLVGVFVFQRRAGMINWPRLLVSLAALIVVMQKWHGIPVTVVAISTGLIIATCNFQSRILNKLGDVSYSLYLLHLPIGLRVIYWTSQLPYSGTYIVAIDALAVAASLLASWWMWKLVEEPSQRLSSSIKLVKPAPPVEVLLEPITAGD